jgi:hypothetical protein
MSDSVTKWHEMNDQTEVWHAKAKKFISKGHKEQAYRILVEYPKEAILEAARIIKVGE